MDAEREAFIHRYMANGGITDYRIDDDKVHFLGRTQYALPCACEEEGCDGWAMIPADSKGWHEFQNGRMTYEDAMALDHAPE